MAKFRILALLISMCLLLTENRRSSLLIQNALCVNHMTNETGICTFNWFCVNVAHGIHIGTCVDRFFVATCCKIPSKDEKNSTNDSTEPSKKGREMDTPVSRIHLLETSVKEQKKKFSPLIDIKYPSTSSPIPTIRNSMKSPVVKKTLTSKGYWNYIFLLGHNVRPFIEDKSLNLQKPISMNENFDHRKPVKSGTDFDNRTPVVVEKAHNQRISVMNEDSREQRLPPKLAADFNNRKPVAVVKDHDERIPVMNEEFHNQRLPPEFQIPDIKKSNCSTYLVEEKNSSSPDVGKVCGRTRRSRTKRIIGGQKSNNFRWPWMISLWRNERETFQYRCGATLLNQFWAATAAHCVDGKRMKDIRLRFGEQNPQRSDKTPIEREVCQIMVHPEYEPGTYENDIALLRFVNPVQYQADIVPVCLPNPEEDITGQIAVVTGFGKLTEYDGDTPSILHEVLVPILSNSVCEQMYLEAGYNETIRKTSVCAGHEHLDSCEGDSGGPMVVKYERGPWLLVGVISWGMSCGEFNMPGVYTRVSEFNNWINEIIDH